MLVGNANGLMRKMTYCELSSSLPSAFDVTGEHRERTIELMCLREVSPAFQNKLVGSDLNPAKQLGSTATSFKMLEIADKSDIDRVAYRKRLQLFGFRYHFEVCRLPQAENCLLYTSRCV